MAEGMERNTGSSMGIRHNLLLCGTVYHEEQLFSNLAISTLFEIALIVSGAGIHRVIDKDIPCKSGDIFVMPPNVRRVSVKQLNLKFNYFTASVRRGW